MCLSSFFTSRRSYSGSAPSCTPQLTLTGHGPLGEECCNALSILLCGCWVYKDVPRKYVRICRHVAGLGYLQPGQAATSYYPGFKSTGGVVRYDIARCVWGGGGYFYSRVQVGGTATLGHCGLTFAFLCGGVMSRFCLGHRFCRVPIAKSAFFLLLLLALRENLANHEDFCMIRLPVYSVCRLSNWTILSSTMVPLQLIHRYQNAPKFSPNLSIHFAIIVFEYQTMTNQTVKLDNNKTELVPISADEEIATCSQGSIPLSWSFVFHRINSSTGSLCKSDAEVFDSLGAVMEWTKTRYREFLPKSWVGRFVSRVVVERATMDRVC